MNFRKDNNHIEISYQFKYEIKVKIIEPSCNYRTELRRHGWGFNPSVNWLIMYYDDKVLLKQQPTANWSENELISIHEESEKWRNSVNLNS